MKVLPFQRTMKFPFLLRRERCKHLLRILINFFLLKLDVWTGSYRDIQMHFLAVS